MKPAPPAHWHALAATDAAARLAVVPARGLSAAEAAERLVHHGLNQPTPPPGHAAWRRFADQLTQPLVLVLIASGLVTAMLSEWVDAGVILGVVLVNAIIGFVQEGKAADALAALARSVDTDATVLRDGRRQRVDARHLVPGDIVLLAPGDKVPADLRLLHARGLRLVEATLTGEAAPSDKRECTLPEDTPLADRRNMAHAGTVVVAGQGRGLVVATADATATGRIAHLIATAPDLATPLTRKMARFADRMLWVILGLAALTFAVGIARGESAFDMFMAAVALAVGAIPEGLPAAITITLAIGVGRMARRRAIIRHLPAVEALGSTTVICSDKTGTLTENAMTVRALFTGDTLHPVTGDGHAPVGTLDGPPTAALREALLAAALCNDATLHCQEGQWRSVGDPTEAALLVAAHKGGVDADAARASHARVDELPFEAERQWMATLHVVAGQRVAYYKGALEKLLPACAKALTAGGDMGPLDRDAIAVHAENLARAGMRVLLLARRDVPDNRPLDEHLPQGLIFLGLAGMLDPPRRQAIAAVRACHAAGIAVKMITGDHAATALAVARQVGIVATADAAVLTGSALAALDAAALRHAAARVAVFARVAPEQKLRLVRALQANGEIVAMTGDGVNDAPALKSADIGIAMGRAGTEVAKDAAAMVLTDDNFATIEAAVEEGRGTYDNLVKFITWTLPTNFGEGLVILAAILAGATLPITPLQILWINMTTAVLLGLALAFEPLERGIMRRPPRAPAQPVLDTALVVRIVLVSALLLVGAFGLFLHALDQGRTLAEARTLAANVFVLVEMGYLFNCRSLARPFFAIAPFSNPWVWAGTGLMFALQLAFTYAPFMHRAFDSAPIGLADWLTILAVAAIAVAIVEAEKAFQQRRRGGGPRSGHV